MLDIVRKVDPLTTSRPTRLQDVLTTWEAKLAELETEQAKVRADLPAVIALGDTKLLDREQNRDTTLSGKISSVRNTIAIVTAQLQEEREHARRAEASAKLRQGQAAGDEVVARASEVQATLELLVQQTAACIKADHAFVATLEELKTGANGDELRDILVLRQFMQTLPRAVGIARFALSGTDRPRNVIESEFELRQRGAHLVSEQAAAYVANALRIVSINQEP